MNERIKELARRVVGKHRNDVDSISLFDEQIEKFAELLIRECMEVTVNYPHPQTKLTAAEHIARHFGVE